MIADLITIGIFSATGYETPPGRTIILPGININRAPIPCPQLPPQFADAVIDYKLDWSALLLGDTIKAASVQTIGEGTAAPSRMVFDEATCSFFISGGTSGFATSFECKVSTPIGRTFEVILTIVIL